MAHTPRTNRIEVVILFALVGVFLILAVPWIVNTSLERVLAKLIDVVVNEPKFASKIMHFSFFSPVWRALVFIAGVTLIVMTHPLNRGKDRAFTAVVTPSWILLSTAVQEFTTEEGF
jgi:hypothetical protein